MFDLVFSSLVASLYSVEAAMLRALSWSKRRRSYNNSLGWWATGDRHACWADLTGAPTCVEAASKHAGDAVRGTAPTLKAPYGI